MSSEWVEIEAAWGKKDDKLIPVLLDDVHNDIPIEFSRIEATNLADWQNNPTDPGTRFEH